MTELHIPLADGDVAIEPLAERHRDALRSACAQDPAIWPIYSTSYDPAHFDAAFDALIGHPTRLPFAVLQNGRLVGMTAYLGINAGFGLLEIGNTYLEPSVRGTGFNRRLKRLMIDHAIACGFRRIEFRIDDRNGRSKAAVAAIGGRLEGLLRQERITWTGHVRDTALFAILADEWRGNRLA
jgi:RimJ/RimL family protein N-acetyltransferase